jgi:hypothetical protein
MIKSKHFAFFVSLFGGVFIWFFIFILFPAKIISPFAKESFWFIFLSYVFLILGYLFFPNTKTQNKGFVIISKRFIYIIIGTTLMSYLFRYIDLFIFRKVSFSNDVWQNRALLAETKPNFIFTLSAILTHLYFIPVIFVLKNKITEKKIIMISLLLFLLPFIEGFIRGSRNAFFTPVILLLIILLYFKKIFFTRKHILLIIFTITILFTIATSIIMQREAGETDDNYSSLTTDFFLNKFLEPSPVLFEVIHSTNNNSIKKMMVSGFQIAQYYVHGVFEFDNLVKYYQKTPIKHQYGKFTFSIINKFTNKYEFTDSNLEEVQLMNPRGITFLTFFGGLYVDFGWFGLIMIFLYGCFQKRIVNKITFGNNSYLPLFFFLLFCNFFMLTFNFLRGMGTYILVVCFTFVFSLSLWNKILLKNK